ncbi:MAG: hypothetical protein AAF206_03475 [Bacteroidota bacterium]
MKSNTQIAPGHVPVSLTIFLLLVFLLASMSEMMAQRRVQNYAHTTEKNSVLKINAVNMLWNEYTVGLEARSGRKLSVYANGGWIDKNKSDVGVQGLTFDGGVRLYHNLPKRLRKGKSDGRLGNFEGNYLTAQVRYNRLRELGPDGEGIGALNQEVTKFALHYGIQRTWNWLYMNFEFGPSWGSSDFSGDLNNNHVQRYYLKPNNFDAKFTMGFMF